MEKFVKAAIFLFVITSITDINAQSMEPESFVPANFFLIEKIVGDLNKDGKEDCVLFIKGTDKRRLIINRFNLEADRNRRGIVILFSTQDGYEIILKNVDCFYSENEDGGGYYPPQLSISIDTGKLYIDYHHGKYGYWKYTLRHKDSDFELIGFDATSSFGPVIQKETSINFLTKKKLIRENINLEAEADREFFKETWTTIALKECLKLSKIEDFEEIDTSNW